MIFMNRYSEAKEIYLKYGIDTEKALEKLKDVCISVHCWQGDDVVGFDNKEALSGGIQTTGNYPGKARNPEELMADYDKAFSLIPGKKKLNLHACYGIFEDGEEVGRDKIEPKHFKKWVDFAKERNMGIDFNPTFFSHPMVKDNLTLSSPDEEVRKYWVNHGKACIKIAEYFANETGVPCVMNIWIPDGYKDIPADRLSPRARFKNSLDEILDTPYDKQKVYVTLESKVFGIGLESYTVGSAEFCLSYSDYKGITPLMDNGHYHPTEMVSDKISSLLLFNEKIALHITRAVRWDSDHVVIFDDETKEIAKEIVRNDALDRVFIATDYFDASINRISAWVTGVRSVQKALLFALLQPVEKLMSLQQESNFTEVMYLQEEMKTMPFGDVWEEFLRREKVEANYLNEVKTYEKEVLSKR
ncbi:MAG: L-rhamnose isomerase [Clostridia bacterium]|nr:L-rhamnose isomerase [Clostridia bacterium]